MAFESMKNHMFSQSIMSTSTEQKEALGTLRVLDDGRKFRYCKNGAVALIPAVCVMPPTGEANHTNQAIPAAVAVGAKEMKITLGATLATADQYAGGYILINDAAADVDRGHQYKIARHAAHAGGGDLTVYLDEPVIKAIPDTAEATLVPSMYRNVVVTTGVDTPAAGVTVCNVAANAYFWAQSGGEGAALGDANTAAVGRMVTPGAAGVVRLAAGLNNHIIGVTRYATVNTDVYALLLQID